MVTFSLLFVLFFGLFKSALCDNFSHGSTVYSQQQLLALRPSGLIHAERPRIPEELRRKWMGCRARVKRQERRQRSKQVYRRSPWGTSAVSPTRWTSCRPPLSRTSRGTLAAIRATIKLWTPLYANIENVYTSTTPPPSPSAARITTLSICSLFITR